MAWRCSASSHAELVEKLYSNKVITKSRVRDTMLKVDRKFFTPFSPYEDSPQSIGYGATISAPHMHAYALGNQLAFKLNMSFLFFNKIESKFERFYLSSILIN
jgi:protein-L-isoaspartate(D-aspartate) O-methyltransferase